METVIRIIQFFLSLTLLVTVHEFGHFIVARLFKIRVDKFYIFFDWGFSLFKFRRGETEYGMGWLPLGGYCQIAGMVDENQSSKDLAAEPQPWEFRSKPAWQRFCVLVAGVTMNVILAFIIYCGISYAWGERYLAVEDVNAGYGYAFNADGEQLGFVDGDGIVAINGEQMVNSASILSRIILAEKDLNVDIVRDGNPQSITIEYDKVNALRQKPEFGGFCTVLYPFIIDSVLSSEATEAGLKANDQVVGIDGINEVDFAQYAPLLSQRAGKSAELTVVRGNEILKILVPVNNEGKIGVSVAALPYTMRTKSFSLLESIPAGARLTARTIENYWSQLKLIVKPDTGLYKQVGGFIAIGKIFPGTWDWFAFWSMTAFLSIILAIMNIIPIPGLDGGHTLFTLWEMITRRKVSDKVLEIAQYIGLFLLLALMLFANGNDIYKELFH
ncbi:MAG: RIP metalloprotease RseP [Alistipes sp.]|nr:RIP metalloprotease RseP [Alistipes sp.]